MTPRTGKRTPPGALDRRAFGRASGIFGVFMPRRLGWSYQDHRSPAQSNFSRRAAGLTLKCMSVTLRPRRRRPPMRWAASQQRRTRASLAHDQRPESCPLRLPNGRLGAPWALPIAGMHSAVDKPSPTPSAFRRRSSLEPWTGVAQSFGEDSCSPRPVTTDRSDHPFKVRQLCYICTSGAQMRDPC